MENIPKELILVINEWLDDKSKLWFLSVCAIYDQWKNNVKFNSELDANSKLWYRSSFNHFRVYHGNSNVADCKKLTVVRDVKIGTDRYNTVAFWNLKLWMKKLALRTIIKSDNCRHDKPYIRIFISSEILEYVEKHHVDFSVEFTFDRNCEWNQLDCKYMVNWDRYQMVVAETDIVKGRNYVLYRSLLES